MLPRLNHLSCAIHINVNLYTLTICYYFRELLKIHLRQRFNDQTHSNNTDYLKSVEKWTQKATIQQMQLILNQNDRQQKHQPLRCCSALTCLSLWISRPALRWADVYARNDWCGVWMTTGAATSPSSSDSWSIGLRELEPILARMQSGLNDLGPAHWDGRGEWDEASIQKRERERYELAVLCFLTFSLM